MNCERVINTEERQLYNWPGLFTRLHRAELIIPLLSLWFTIANIGRIKKLLVTFIYMGRGEVGEWVDDVEVFDSGELFTRFECGNLYGLVQFLRVIDQSEYLGSFFQHLDLIEVLENIGATVCVQDSEHRW